MENSPLIYTAAWKISGFFIPIFKKKVILYQTQQHSTNSVWKKTGRTPTYTGIRYNKLRKLKTA